MQFEKILIEGGERLAPLHVEIAAGLATLGIFLQAATMKKTAGGKRCLWCKAPASCRMISPGENDIFFCKKCEPALISMLDELCAELEARDKNAKKKRKK